MDLTKQGASVNDERFPTIHRPSASRWCCSVFWFLAGCGIFLADVDSKFMTLTTTTTLRFRHDTPPEFVEVVQSQIDGRGTEAGMATMLCVANSRMPTPTSSTDSRLRAGNFGASDYFLYCYLLFYVVCYFMQQNLLKWDVDRSAL